MTDFSDQVAQFMPGLQHHARKFTSSAADAEDLAQDTVLHALEKQHLYDEHGTMWSWLYRMMRRLAIDRTRTGARNRVRQVDYKLGLPQRDIADPETYAMAADVERAFRALPKNRQRFIKMSHQGVRTKQMAKIEGVPLGTILSNLARARASVRKALN